MRADNILIEWNECLVCAFPALNLRFPTDPSNPLVPTHGRITRLAALRILPSVRKHIVPSPEKAPKECDFVGGRGTHRDAREYREPLCGRASGAHVFKRAQPFGDLRPFPVERGQSALQSRNLLSDFVRLGDVIVPLG
jgi:hypothetical protein